MKFQDLGGTINRATTLVHRILDNYPVQYGIYKFNNLCIIFSYGIFEE